MNNPTKYVVKAKTHGNTISTARGIALFSKGSMQNLVSKLILVNEAVEDLADCSYDGLFVKGKTVCSADDVFNAKTGMKIATLRAKRTGVRRYIRKVRALKNLVQALDKELLGINIDLVNEEVDLQNQLDTITL